MKFSYHHGYGSGFIHKTVRDEAAKWIRKRYFSDFLERITHNGMSLNPDKKPIPVYRLINGILAFFYTCIGDSRPIVVPANRKPLSINREI